MFKFNNLTDFEKLLFAIKQIKDLKFEISKLNIENGILRSEIDELEYNYKTKIKELNLRVKAENPPAHKLQKYKVQIKDLRIKCKKYEQMYDKVNHEFIMLKNNCNNIE